MVKFWRIASYAFFTASCITVVNGDYDASIYGLGFAIFFNVESRNWK
jgi:hypothetical protein